ncbi:hypothetical protein CEUSTIGMA_g4883.t1 [Chlamydomonas eustigma]|uniref:Uncharacterized protein n=1 Tax=Chlamydomonas eustigma TaxID=1157962 RepID=A0A250X2Z2_9CHLO|nr:hypothetical protein CEUSTIGMA_g4883.t1 [Chlamydomonas eustigma]|eukprot:GAX77438.1 hypothetical protein CEUSTIGMA_g4883.t1 [Chlamydomonas eustigma]
MKEQLNKANEREGELQKQLTDYQAKHEQQQQQLNSLMLVLQGMQGLGLAGGMGGGGIGSLLSSLCVGGLNGVDNPEGDAPEHLSSGINTSSPDADAAAAMMDQVRVLHAEMSSVQHCVNQLSSRLGGVAVLPHKKTLSSFNEGADVGYCFDTQQLTHGGIHTSSSKAVIKEARLTDDLMPENDID